MSGSAVNSPLKKATPTLQALKEQFIRETVSNNFGYITGCPLGKAKYHAPDTIASKFAL